MKKFVIIDGNAIVHRSYHAVPKTLTGPDGKPTNASYGFFSILMGIMEYENPDYLATCFDMKGPTFRHKEFAAYKETRAKTEDDLIVQFPQVRSILNGLGIPVFEKEGLEADDFLGLIAEKVSLNQDLYLIIVTGDQDALQLVSDRVEVVAPISGYSKVKRYNRAGVKEKLGVWPEQVADYKGLRGDLSDNIPGVPGIGEKIAAGLLEKYKSLEDIYENIERIEPERVKNLLKENEEKARLSKKIATILREDRDFMLDMEKCRVNFFDFEGGKKLFSTLAFKSLIGRVQRFESKFGKSKIVENQAALF